MEPLDTLLKGHIRSLAIVGLAKNTGKTTTFNWILECLANKQKKVAVASIGVDGEKMDVWDGQEKPAVTVTEGMLVAIASQALEEAEARFRLLEQLKRTSPLGPVYLTECTRGGRVVLAGTQRNEDIKRFIERTQAYEADYWLIDGAYDRLASAQRELVQGVILCTGAAVDPNLEQALKKTEEQVLKWRLPVWPEEAIPLDERVHLFHDGRWQSTHYPSVLPYVEDIRLSLAQGVDALYIPGALTERIHASFEGAGHPFAWVVDDPTKLFLSSATLRKWYRKGGSFFVRRKSELVALSVNPFTLYGEADDRRWLDGCKQIAGDIPVLNVRRRHVL